MYSWRWCCLVCSKGGVLLLVCEWEGEAARWAGALQEALHALRAQARAAHHPACFLEQAVISCSAAVEAPDGPGDKTACAGLQGHYKRLGNGLRDANSWPGSTLAAGSGAAGDAAGGGAVPGALSAESSPAPSEVHAAPWAPQSQSPNNCIQGSSCAWLA